LIQYDSSFAPPGNTFDSLDVITPKIIRKENDEMAITQQHMLEASSIMGSIANALGIPALVMFDSNGNWIRAGNRAALIAQKRSEIGVSGKQDNE
jgi:hypothetical protein